jgi:hypothetical protein
VAAAGSVGLDPLRVRLLIGICSAIVWTLMPLLSVSIPAAAAIGAM